MAPNNKSRFKLQKSKKHKKIKAIDPFYTGERKNIYDRKNINLAPDNDDDDVPRMWKEIMQLKEQYEKKTTKSPRTVDAKVEKDCKKDAAGNVKQKKVKQLQPNKQKQPQMIANSEAAPMYIPLVKKDEESDWSYLHRTKQEVRKVFEKSRLSDKYKIQYADVESGKSNKRVIKASKKKRLKELTKLKKEKKEEYKNRNNTGFEHFKDEVVFGEVAMAPPVIKAKPRKADSSNVSKPGRKQLLLKKILEQNSEPKAKQNPETKTKKNSESKPKDKKSTKLKYLSLAKQSMLSEERERVVKLYREMKKKNRAANKK
ncbi:Hypothetical predicted protein [Octopus vulgaris]|uniref:Coiled-coil domain-containing protein 137 n=1 Tax=Octopus vulgaris TaxID=6645 RepID=A0AA36AYL5_OCTVU|nr:Hypothetical predicted protein [Octopus vulgaris]